MQSTDTPRSTLEAEASKVLALEGNPLPARPGCSLPACTAFRQPLGCCRRRRSRRCAAAAHSTTATFAAAMEKRGAGEPLPAGRMAEELKQSGVSPTSGKLGLAHIRALHWCIRRPGPVCPLLLSSAACGPFLNPTYQSTLSHCSGRPGGAADRGAPTAFSRQPAGR